MGCEFDDLSTEELIKVYVPDVYMDSMLQIDYGQLRAKGVKLISFDMDDTIAGALDAKLSRRIITKFEVLKSEGFDLMIISNNGSLKVKHFAEELGIEFIAHADKPKRNCFFKAIEMYNAKHKDNQITVKNMAHVGNSILNDVAGANVAGVISCLVRHEGHVGGVFDKLFAHSEHELRDVLKERKIWRKHHKKGKGHGTQYYQLNEGYKHQVW